MNAHTDTVLSSDSDSDVIVNASSGEDDSGSESDESITENYEKNAYAEDFVASEEERNVRLAIQASLGVQTLSRSQRYARRAQE